MDLDLYRIDRVEEKNVDLNEIESNQELDLSSNNFNFDIDLVRGSQEAIIDRSPRINFDNQYFGYENLKFNKHYPFSSITRMLIFYQKLILNYFIKLDTSIKLLNS
jgi:hypothetical protein